MTWFQSICELSFRSTYYSQVFFNEPSLHFTIPLTSALGGISRRTGLLERKLRKGLHFRRLGQRFAKFRLGRRCGYLTISYSFHNLISCNIFSIILLQFFQMILRKGIGIEDDCINALSVKVERKH